MTGCDCPIPAGCAVSLGCGSDELQAAVSPSWLYEQASTLEQKKKKNPLFLWIKGTFVP